MARLVIAWLLVLAPQLQAQQPQLANDYLDHLIRLWEEDSTGDDVEALGKPMISYGGLYRIQDIVGVEGIGNIAGSGVVGQP